MENRDVWKTVNWLNRSQIVRILENHGFACYEKESDQELRQCLVDEVMSGEIDPSELE